MQCSFCTLHSSKLNIVSLPLFCFEWVACQSWIMLLQRNDLRWLEQLRFNIKKASWDGPDNWQMLGFYFENCGWMAWSRWLQMIMSTNFLHSGAKVAGAKWSDRHWKSASYRFLMTTLWKYAVSLLGDHSKFVRGWWWQIFKSSACDWNCYFQTTSSEKKKRLCAEWKWRKGVASCKGKCHWKYTHPSLLMILLALGWGGGGEGRVQSIPINFLSVWFYRLYQGLEWITNHIRK